MKLVATGRVDFDALVKSADRHCGQWKHFEVSRQKGPADVPSAPPLFIPRDGAAQQYIVQVSPAPSAESSDRYAQNLMASIFGDESGSRLFWELVDTGLAEYAVAGTHEFQGAGITMTFLSCGPEDARDNYLAIGNLQEQIQSEGVTESELELCQKQNLLPDCSTRRTAVQSALRGWQPLAAAGQLHHDQGVGGSISKRHDRRCSTRSE